MLIDKQHWVFFVDLYISELLHKRRTALTVLVCLSLHLKVLRVEYGFFTQAVRTDFVNAELAENLHGEEKQLFWKRFVA